MRTVLMLLLSLLLSLLVLAGICRIASRSRSPRLRTYAQRYLAFSEKYCGSDPLVPLIVLLLITATLLFS